MSFMSVSRIFVTVRDVRYSLYTQKSRVSIRRYFACPGAGVRPYSGDVHMASKGVITLEIGIHGIPVTMSQMIYDVLSKGALNGYPYRNDNSRDKELL